MIKSFEFCITTQFPVSKWILHLKMSREICQEDRTLLPDSFIIRLSISKIWKRIFRKSNFIKPSTRVYIVRCMKHIVLACMGYIRFSLNFFCMHVFNVILIIISHKCMCYILNLSADKVDLKRQMTLHQLKTTSSRKIANVAPLERQTDTEKTVHQTSTTSVSQEQVN